MTTTKQLKIGPGPLRMANTDTYRIPMQRPRPRSPSLILPICEMLPPKPNIKKPRGSFTVPAFSHFLISSLVQQAAAQFTRRETLPCNHDLTLTRCSAQPLFSRYHLPRREYVSVHKIHESHSPSVGRCYNEYFANIWITDMN